MLVSSLPGRGTNEHDRFCDEHSRKSTLTRIMSFGMPPSYHSKASRSPPRFRHPRRVGPEETGADSDRPRPEARDLAAQSPKRKQRHFQVSAEAEAQGREDHLDRLAGQVLADLFDPACPPDANREASAEIPPHIQRDPEGAQDSLVTEQASQAADALLGPDRAGCPRPSTTPAKLMELYEAMHEERPMRNVETADPSTTPRASTAAEPTPTPAGVGARAFDTDDTYDPSWVVKFESTHPRELGVMRTRLATLTGHASPPSWSRDTSLDSSRPPESKVQWTPPQTAPGARFDLVPDVVSPGAALASRVQLHSSLYPGLNECIALYVDFDESDSAPPPGWCLGKVTGITGTANERVHRIEISPDPDNCRRFVTISLIAHPIQLRWARVSERKRSVGTSTGTTPRPALKSRMSGSMAALSMDEAVPQDDGGPSRPKHGSSPQSSIESEYDRFTTQSPLDLGDRQQLIDDMPTATPNYPATRHAQRPPRPVDILRGDVIGVAVPTDYVGGGDVLSGIVTSTSMQVAMSDGSIHEHVCIQLQCNANPVTVRIDRHCPAVTATGDWFWHSRVVTLGTDSRTQLPPWIANLHFIARLHLYSQVSGKDWPWAQVDGDGTAVGGHSSGGHATGGCNIGPTDGVHDSLRVCTDSGVNENGGVIGNAGVGGTNGITPSSNNNQPGGSLEAADIGGNGVSVDDIDDTGAGGGGSGDNRDSGDTSNGGGGGGIVPPPPPPPPTPMANCTRKADCSGCNSTVGRAFAAALGGGSYSGIDPESCLSSAPASTASRPTPPAVEHPPVPSADCPANCSGCVSNRPDGLATHVKSKGWWVRGCPFPSCPQHRTDFGDLKAYRKHVTLHHGGSIDEPWFRRFCAGADEEKPVIQTCEHCKLPFRILSGHYLSCYTRRAKESMLADPSYDATQWRDAAFASSRYRVGLPALLNSRKYTYSDIASLRKSMASAADQREAKRLVRQLNAAIIDAVRQAAKQLYGVHPDSCQYAMVEDTAKLVTLLALQVQLQDAGKCHTANPFIDNSRGDAVPTATASINAGASTPSTRTPDTTDHGPTPPSAASAASTDNLTPALALAASDLTSDGSSAAALNGLPEYRTRGASSVVTRVDGFMRNDLFAVDFAVAQLKVELVELREANAAKRARVATTSSTPAHDGRVPERYQTSASAAQDNMRNVSRKVVNGELSKARQAMLSNSARVVATEERVKKLQSLFKPGARKTRGTRTRPEHPANSQHPAGVPARHQIPTMPAAPEASSDVVRRALSKISRTVGAGIDGIGRHYFENMLHMDDLVILVNLALNGMLPPEWVRASAGGSVVMIGKPKKPGDIRPIVPQSQLIRLPAKVLLTLCRLGVKRAIDPWQGAVNVAAGAETIAAIFAQTMYRSRNSVGIISDKKNGYGETERDKILQWVNDELPLMLRFITMVYGDYVELFFIDEHGEQASIEVWDGSLQGDVLSALVFTGVGSKGVRTAMAKVFDRMRTMGQDPDRHELIGLLMRYIDDRSDNTTVEHVEWYLKEVLVPNLESDDANGQFVGPNDLKVVVHDPALIESARFQPLQEYVERRRALGFALKIQWVSLEGDDPDGVRGVDLLGVPIGTDQYVERALQHRLERTQRELEAIEMLPTQHRLLILRYCIVSEINFWCRTLTPQQNRVAIADIERRVSIVLRRAMHLTAEGDPPGHHDGAA